MDIRDILVRYGIFLGKRFRWKQKQAFANYISDEFQKLGYGVQGQISERKKNYALNIIVGDLTKAKKIVIAHYDTPQRSFLPIKYYPFNEYKSFKASLFPLNAPFLVLFSMIFVILYFVRGYFGFTGLNLNTFVSILFVVVLALLSFVFSLGIANPINLRRNSAAVITALVVAEQLKAKKDIAYVLTDRETSDHEGDRMIQKALPVTLKNREVVHLHCLGKGPVVGIGYGEEAESHASKFADVIKGNHETFLKLMDEKEKRVHSLGFYPKGITISTGIKIGEEILVENTSTKKDSDVDMEFLISISTSIVNYLK